MERVRKLAQGSSKKGAGSLFGVLMMIVMPVGIAGCGDADPTVDLPAGWVDMATGTSSSVEFRADGTGTFSDFPLLDGDACNAESLAPYSGDFSWSWNGDGYFELVSPGNPAIFAPDGELMGSINWERLVVNYCGLGSPADMRVVYLITEIPGD